MAHFFKQNLSQLNFLIQYSTSHNIIPHSIVPFQIIFVIIYIIISCDISWREKVRMYLILLQINWKIKVGFVSLSIIT